jgi:uncharacterized protein (TIGR03086 family)
MSIDFAPATTRLADLVTSVHDDRLRDPTPCPAYAVGDLVEHIGGLACAFTLAARKERRDPERANPAGDASRLEPGWRDRIAHDLTTLAAAWGDPAAYDGMTQAGPIDLPAQVAALVALDEVVVHGWDLARATGAPYDPDEDSLRSCLTFAQGFETPPGAGRGPFGPPVAVPESAPLLDRLVGATGRDPRWSAVIRAV